MSVLVYVARCLNNSKQYVGITSQTLAKRKSKHQSDARQGSEYFFHKALRKYGYDAFVWEVVCVTADRGQACQEEQRLIKLLDSCNPDKGYNLTWGGDGMTGFHLKDSSRLKISRTLKNWHASDDPAARLLRDKLRQLKIGTKAKESTLKKLSEKALGRELSESAREKVSAAKRKYSDSVVEEVSAYALEHGYRQAERQYGIPRQTIRRWTWSKDRLTAEKAKMRERARRKVVSPFLDISRLDSD